MVVIDSKLYPTIRESAILTGSYVAATILTGCERYNQLWILAQATIGNLVTIDIKVEFSWDGVTYFQETFDVLTTGVSTSTLGVHKIGATGNYPLSIKINTPYIKISAIGSGGTATNSLLQLDVALGVC